MLSRRTGDSAVCRHHDTCLRRDGKYQHFPRRCYVRRRTDTSSAATGDKILVDDNSGKYSVASIQSLDTAAGTASVKNVISGDTTEITVRATVSKVIVTIPVIGFLSMASQAGEGIMIIGLAILFLVILFILSEVWKRDEEEDEEEEEEDEDEDDEESVRRASQQKESCPGRKKETGRTGNDRTVESSRPENGRRRNRQLEIPDLEEEGTEQVSFHTVDLQNLVRGEETEEIPGSRGKNGNCRRSCRKETPAEEVTEETEETESAEPGTVEEIEEFEETIEEPEPEPSEPIELAMPVYTAEELLQKAHAAGDDPKVIEDPATGITILDYSDIL